MSPHDLKAWADLLGLNPALFAIAWVFYRELRRQAALILDLLNRVHEGQVQLLASRRPWP